MIDRIDPQQQEPSLSPGRLIFAGVVSLVAALLALVTSWAVTKLLRGRNISDVGVPMYPSSGLALTAGWIVYIILGLGLVWIVGRTIGRGSLMAYVIGLLAWTVGMVLNLLTLRWLAG